MMRFSSRSKDELLLKFLLTEHFCFRRSNNFFVSTAKLTDRCFYYFTVAVSTANPNDRGIARDVSVTLRPPCRSERARTWNGERGTGSGKRGISKRGHL